MSDEEVRSMENEVGSAQRRHGEEQQRMAVGGEEPAVAHPTGESRRREGASESGEEARQATGRESERE